MLQVTLHGPWAIIQKKIVQIDVHLHEYSSRYDLET